LEFFKYDETRLMTHV